MDALTLSDSFASLLVDTAAKGTVLLLLATLAAWFCRRSSAALRHAIWCMAMGGLLALPIASWAMPSWQLPILPPTPVSEFAQLPASTQSLPNGIRSAADSTAIKTSVPPQSPPRSTDATSSTVVTPVAKAPPVSSPVEASVPAIVEPQTPRWSTIECSSLVLVAAWCLGVTAYGCWLVAGLCWTIRLRKRSVAVVDDEWAGMLTKLRQRLGLSRSTELREHTESIIPLTWGIWRPVILIPRSARSWSEPMRRAVVLHELAHVQRGDVAFQMLGRVACVFYWFHPLAWFALRQLLQEREQACDDAVVQSGEKASDYAEQLLAVARLCCVPRGLSLGVAMAEGSSLERRVVTLFDNTRSHGPLTRSAAIASLMICGAILVGLAPLQPATSQAESGEQPKIASVTNPIFMAQVVDARGKPIAHAKVIFPFNMNDGRVSPQMLESLCDERGEVHVELSRNLIEKASFNLRDVVWAVKDGHAIGAAMSLFSADRSAITRIVIPDKEPVEFIVQSDSGQPLAGVSVTPESLIVPNWNGNSEDQQGAVTRIPEPLQPRLTKVSDSEGRIVFDEFPRNWHNQLQMTSEQYGVQYFSAPRKFLRLLPVTSISGKLSNSQPGVKLICTIPHQYAGSYINASAEAITDAAGNFSIPKFPIGPVTITSVDLQGPMFLEDAPREVAKDSKNHFDLKVVPGIKVHGRVMLEKPSRGIRKAVVSFTDGLGKPFETDENGVYATHARPQQRIATYFVGGSAELFPLIGNGAVLSSASIKVPQGATEVTLPDIVLAEGRYLTGQLVDENKQPIPGVYVAPFPCTSPFQLQTGPNGHFGAQVRADKPPSGWIIGWDSPPQPGNDFDATWAKVISDEPLVLQVSPKAPGRHTPYSEVDMDSPVPMDRVVWGEIVDGWQPGFWLKSTGEPTNQQVPLNALVTYRTLLRNTSERGRDVVFRSRPDLPYVIPSDQIAKSLAAEELPLEFRSDISKNGYRGEHDYVIFIEAGESLLVYGHATSHVDGLFVGEGDSRKYSKMARIAQPGKNWIVHPLSVQTLTPDERKQLEESLKTDRSRSTWDITMLDRSGQPRKETAKTATPQTEEIPATPFDKRQTLHAKIELDIGTVVAALPVEPENTPQDPKEDPPYPFESFAWGDAVDGLRASVICKADINAPGIVEFNEILPCAVQVRNTTAKRIEFLVRMELPYLIPADRFQGVLLPQFQAEPARRNTEMPDPVYRISLGPGEIVLIPRDNVEQSPESAISVGDALGILPESEREFTCPRIGTVHVGTNWLVQPMKIQTVIETDEAALKTLPGEVKIITVDSKGKVGEAIATRVDSIPRGMTLLAQDQVEVATQSFLREKMADGVTWGLIDKGLQCGIRLVNPQASYKVGDTLAAEVLWRNSSDDPIETMIPMEADLAPVIRDADGRELTISLESLYAPVGQTIESKEILNLGVKNLTLAPAGPRHRK